MDLCKLASVYGIGMRYSYDVWWQLTAICRMPRMFPPPQTDSYVEFMEARLVLSDSSTCRERRRGRQCIHCFHVQFCVDDQAFDDPLPFTYLDAGLPPREGVTESMPNSYQYTFPNRLNTISTVINNSKMISKPHSCCGLHLSST